MFLEEEEVEREIEERSREVYGAKLWNKISYRKHRRRSAFGKLENFGYL